MLADVAMWTWIALGAGKVFGIFTIFMLGLTWLPWYERRLCAWMQDRSGPNRVGPLGLLQPVADGIKLIQKEDLIPDHVEKFLYVLGPALVAMPALVTFAVIPIGHPVPLSMLADHVGIAADVLDFSWLHEMAAFLASQGADTMSLAASDLPVGLLFLLAVGSLGVYGLALGAWSANNKYALMGGVRASAQMISYELTLGVCIVTLILMSGSGTVGEMVAAQADSWFGVIPKWNILTNPITSIIFIICLFAETNRLPFDFAEAEPELIAGYHIEHSGMKFALFMLGEAAAMMTAAALIVTLCLGGWHVPGLELMKEVLPISALIPMTVGAFMLKWFLVVTLFVLVRWSIPRFRYDQLMDLGWKRMLPASLGMLVLTVIVKEALS